MALVFLYDSNVNLVARAAIGALQEDLTERLDDIRHRRNCDENLKFVTDICDEIRNIARQLVEQDKKLNESKV